MIEESLHDYDDISNDTKIICSIISQVIIFSSINGLCLMNMMKLGDNLHEFFHESFKTYSHMDIKLLYTQEKCINLS